MTPAQAAKVQSAAMIIAHHAVSLVGFPSVIPKFYTDLIKDSLAEIDAVMAEIETEAESCKKAA